ncbi:MAG TPA: 1,4-alpha-glucan branching protein GlgB, partial [Acidimicrobiales bacterium]|nr:1,4-alpha-glucan branching protein GlgB [Acidimicrobiales bacterium]
MSEQRAEGSTSVDAGARDPGVVTGNSGGATGDAGAATATSGGGACDSGAVPASRIGDMDKFLLNEGRHFRLYDVLGAHPLGAGSPGGTHFAVWAPNATAVSVIHDGNGWVAGHDRLEPQGSSGIWAGIVEAGPGTCYKYAVDTKEGILEKADPFAFATELPPRTASIVADLDHSWNDAAWSAERAHRQDLAEPISIYEVHLGSFRRRPDGSFLTYEELAEALVAHAGRLGFTHVELLPVMEHPYYGSWGYQTTSFFAPSARYGTPQGFMTFVETLHQAGIGCILDWVPSHFATDGFSLGYFDGTHLFEHADPNRGIHPDWGSFEFNYGRHEVRSFLVSSARFWLDRYHADGLRVDAVASMLYLDYSRKEGQWSPNRFGGREDLEAIDLLRTVNDTVHADFPGALTIAEESTAWPGVTAPTADGGLGFSLKWDMGWMHDTLSHLQREPVHRKFHYDELTFRALYAGSERYVLPLSHDEVVYGKQSLAAKMPGDDWQRRATLRALFGYQWTLPGKKLIFMGSELATWHEWAHEGELEWSLLEHPDHAGVTRFVADCNAVYRHFDALHSHDTDPIGFQWVTADARDDNVLGWLRWGRTGEVALCALNLTPVVRQWRFGVPTPGRWREVLNSDGAIYGGSGVVNAGTLEAVPIPWSGQPAMLECTLAPLAAMAFVPTDPAPAGAVPAEGASAEGARAEGEGAGASAGSGA